MYGRNVYKKCKEYVNTETIFSQFVAHRLPESNSGSRFTLLKTFDKWDFHVAAMVISLNFIVHKL